MTRNYNIRQRLIACILLLSLFLQSCGKFSNQIMPQEKESADTIRESTKLIGIQQLVEQKLISAGWEVTDLYEEQGELKIKAIERHGNFTSKSHELSIIIAPDVDLEQLSRLSSEEKKGIVYFNPPQSGKFGRVIVSRGGLLGGMKNEGENENNQQEKRGVEDKEKEKKNTLKPNIQISIEPSSKRNNKTYKLTIRNEGEKLTKESLNDIKLKYTVNGIGDLTDVKLESQSKDIEGILLGELLGQKILKGRSKVISLKIKEANADSLNISIFLEGTQTEQIVSVSWAKKGKTKIEKIDKQLSKLRKQLEIARKTGSIREIKSLKEICKGYRYHMGWEVSQDDLEAVNCFRKAADDGNKVARNILGLIYLNGGLRVPKNTALAIESFKNTANQGDAWGEYFLGIMYESGYDGQAPNYTEAIKCFENSAEKGHADAQGYLALLYQMGCQVSQDNLKAEACFKKAIKAAKAKDDCKYLYELGWGLTENCAKPVEILKEKPEARDKEAQYFLGNMYKNGWRVDNDYSEARELFQKAADQGHVRAQLKLGRLYENGYGVKKNHEKAREWYKKAEEQGDKKAKKALSNYDIDSEEESIVEQVNSRNEDNLPKNMEDLLKELNQKLRSNTNNDPIEPSEYSKYSEFCIPLYRGVHYLPRLFPSQLSREKICKDSSKELPLYSSSAYEAADLTFLTPLSALTKEQKEELENYAKAIKMALDEFNASCSELYHKFHEVYSNDHEDFHQRLNITSGKKNRKTAVDSKKTEAFEKYREYFCSHLKKISEEIINKAIKRNPHISFALTPYHAIKYALGDKSFHNPEGGEEELLIPDYDSYGKSKHSYLGKVYVALLPIVDYIMLNPYVVLQNHALKNVIINSNYNNDISKENEVTFSGYLPEGFVIYTKNIRCPRFDNEDYPIFYSDSPLYSSYQDRYGISEKEYYNYRERIKKQEDITDDLYDHIAGHHNSVLLTRATQEARTRNRILIYPGFRNDFVAFPLSSRAANIHAEICGAEDNTICIFPETGKDQLKAREIIYVAQELTRESELERNILIREFSIRNFGIGENGFNLFADIIQKERNSCLTILALENTNPSEEGVENLAIALGTNKTLTDLNIKRNLAVGNKIKTIADALRQNSILRRLDIGEIGLMASGAEYLKAVFIEGTRNTTLTWINLCGNYISNSIRNAILNGVEKNKDTACTELIYQEEVQEKHDAAYIQNRAKEVCEFSIRDVRIEGNDIFTLFSKFLNDSNYSCLTTLALENTNPSKKGVENLAIALGTNKTLTDLNIKRNPIVGKEIKFIIEALSEKNSSLRRLDIGEIGLTKDGGKSLKGLFTGNKRKNTTLIWVNLDGNDISEGSRNFILNGINKNKKEYNSDQHKSNRTDKVSDSEEGEEDKLKVGSTSESNILS